MHGHHHLTAPEPDVVSWAARIADESAARPGTAEPTVLDVAAGGGRHAHWFAAAGHLVTAVDRDTSALAARPHPNIEIVTADLENAPWPLPGRRFDVVVVVNYLWRDLLPTLFASVATGGHLIYATFAIGNERYGRPRNPDFLLRTDELRHAMPDDFELLDFVQGEVGNPTKAVRQGLFARRTR